jgi:DNA-binding transcriptional ArsR family regulator
MNRKTGVSEVAALLADRGRASMIDALLDGRYRPAGELARLARISPQTASAHLKKLTDAGLLACEPQGRHRYYRIAAPEVARVVEQLATLVPMRPVRSLNESLHRRALEEARTCYDHLAGRLALRIVDAMGGDRLEYDDGVFRVSSGALDVFREIGVKVAPGGTRPFALACLDWTERRHHIAGALGAAILDRFLECRWIVRLDNSRAVKLTPAGAAALDAYLSPRTIP